MPTLTVTQTTSFLKKTADSLDTLPESDKFNINSGSTFEVDYAFKVGQHCLVKLSNSLGNVGKIGYFLLEHVNVDLQECRGIWLTNIDSEVLHSEENITEGLTKLKNLGFNTVYPVVWNRGFTLYPSAVAQEFVGAAIAPNFPNLNMLDQAIAVAKSLGLRVIPWFEYGLTALPGSALATKRKDLLTLSKSGDPVRIKSTNNQRDDRVWFNPCHPDVIKFIADLIVEVATKDGIDGIQLDDHFGFPIELGFDEFTQNQFAADNPGVPIPENHQTSTWMNWGIGKMTSLLQEITTKVKGERPECLISISPNPLDFSRNTILVDWRSWIENNLVDELVIQVYRDSLSSLTNEIEKREVKYVMNKIPVIIGIKAGLKGKPVPTEIIKQQNSKVIANNFAGSAFFFYETFFNQILPPGTIVARDEADLKSVFA